MTKRETIKGLRAGDAINTGQKKRIIRAAHAYNARAKHKGQHQGPITWAAFRVLDALLWKFHNSRTGLCFPDFDDIVVAARCSRSTVARAIKALEHAKILTWVHRHFEEVIDGIREFKRTSNAYLFKRPLPDEKNPDIENRPRRVSKCQNEPGTLNQEKDSIYGVGRKAVDKPADNLRPPPILNPASPTDAILIRLGRAMGALPELSPEISTI